MAAFVGRNDFSCNGVLGVGTAFETGRGAGSNLTDCVGTTDCCGTVGCGTTVTPDCGKISYCR